MLCPVRQKEVEMALWKDIDRARRVLGVSEFATLQEIRTLFRNKLKQSHPDAGGDRNETRQIVEAWKVLRHYCENFRFRFNEDEVKRNETPEERLARMYGDDKTWGPHG